jgi:hypothetical protein
MAATIAVGAAVALMSKSIEKEGLEPSPPADDEIEMCEEQTARAISRGLGDAELPWWAPLVLSYGKLYSGMRLEARRKAERPHQHPAAAEETTPAASSPAPSSPPTPARAQGGSVPWQPLAPLQKVTAQ